MSCREVGLAGRVASREDRIDSVPPFVRSDRLALRRLRRRTDIDEDLAVLRKVNVLDRPKDAILEYSMQARHGLSPQCRDPGRVGVPRGRSPLDRRPIRSIHLSIVSPPFGSCQIDLAADVADRGGGVGGDHPRSPEDFLVDLALGRFRRRPPMSALPTGLRRDIRAFFRQLRRRLPAGRRAAVPGRRRRRRRRRLPPIGRRQAPAKCPVYPPHRPGGPRPAAPRL